MDTRVNIRIFDENINFLGEVDYYTSLFYIRKWETYGEFEFHVSKVNIELFKKGNIIMLNNDGNKAGIIEHFEISQEDTEDILIKGFSLGYWLIQRITIPPIGYAYHSFNTNVENIMLELVRHNAIDPEDSNRKIPYLMQATSNNKGEKIQYQTRYKNLADELTKLSKSSGLGWTIDLDYKNKKFIFKVLEGRNLIYGQAENPPMIFASDYDNIKTQQYTDSDIGYKNVAFVAGQGEGEDRQIEIINNELSGLNRRETFVDARDIDENGSLVDRGKMKLSETPQITNFECEVETKDYKVTWDLGDLVTTLNRKLKLRVDNRVSEVKEIYESSGYKVEPIFGTPIPTLGDKIKQMTDSNDGGGTSGVSGGDKSYTFNQVAPKELWKIPHGLGKYPSVSIVDSGGSQVIGEVNYLDSNNVELKFAGAFSGIAYFN